MSKKPTSAESSNEKQTNESSDSLFQERNNYAERTEIASLSSTTLQDLPMEVLEYILIKVIVMEVKSMKLAKCVWKEKSDLVINRLKTVNSHWSSILTTNFFRNELHRTLDKTVQETIRLEILHQFSIPFRVYRVTTMRDGMFMSCREDNSIIVYNRNTMAREKDVIVPQGIDLMQIAGCSVSNCVYASSRTGTAYLSVLRITKDEEHQFNFSRWINDLPCSTMLSVSANGCLVTISGPHGRKPPAVSVYDASGYLQHRVIVHPVIHGYVYFDKAILKLNGNLLLVTITNELKTELTEIDMTGRIERRFQSSIQCGVHLADSSERVVVKTKGDNRIRLLDSELNLLDFLGPPLDWNKLKLLHYNCERNEIVGTLSADQNSSVIATFRFISE